MDPTERTSDHHATLGRGPGHRATLTLLFVLAAVSVSTGLVIYTAWHHELRNGLFALLFAVLSCKAALRWLAWGYQPPNAQPPQNLPPKP